MLIERHLHRTIPVLRPAQLLSVRVMAGEALKANTRADIAKITPHRIYHAVLALNGAYCLCMDAIFSGASAFAEPYRTMEGFATAQRLYRHWLTRADHLAPGDEFTLVDEFADILGIQGWYAWKPDNSPPVSTPDSPREGVSDEALLREKYPAAVCHLLSALERHDKLPAEKIQEITFEVGRTGESGINYSDPDRRYTLKSLPGESFTGLELMCLLFAGLKRLYPDTDTGMDLNEPFLKALELFHERKSGSE
jgi:hypothetical protein